ncbi:NAD-dependent epimerase/dehydratase family protein [Sinorhizobium medicae]|uniref:NAD-dependent epimerase/dehydratase family protein n=2 Tax=Sinorhizobium medicae TaxID=110321 RepID=A0A6G1WIM8_9HYPH|nr:NAD-dependent epimerase/dehydratase family protein [Sinorhizobium medicae]MDX0414281.1 NAD-dependent epimerase/dehydratase family protein [Sinorhizobium medicae]MDX0420144.1 NAD-dependent epimerase/dehydratase family protein [Sinorhizobium medicae]MDX0426536.1 NAD-dependent epimerase/dehydratase family protein [Sinorhizobium medicae]MDX0432383.1 NAD-dependent epimerase/dehydratase family protein [Sinorhizobium medicae]
MQRIHAAAKAVRNHFLMLPAIRGREWRNRASAGMLWAFCGAALDIGFRRIRGAVRSVQKYPALYLTDLASVGVALTMALLLRYGPGELSARPETASVLLWSGAQYLAICAFVFPLSGLYSRNWKYGSISDLFIILRAVLLTSLLLVTLLFFSTRLTDIPRTVVPMQSLLLIAFLAAARLSFRAEELSLRRPVFKSGRNKDAQGDDRIPLLLVGASDAADLYLRALARDPNATYVPVACLDRSEDQIGMSLRGVPIAGRIQDFEQVVAELQQLNKQPRHIVFTEAPAAFGEEASDALLRSAERLGIAVSRLSQMTELKRAKGDNPYELRSIELTDLLERPQAALDREAIDRLVRGRRVLITGAGGSIGSELTTQVAACDPAEIVLIDNTEYNLYAIDMTLTESFPEVPRSSYLCSVRRSQRVAEIFERHRPELVFHAAALKHVPMVQLNPCEGVLTNVVGTMNVANAAKKYGTLAMVQVSTDKVVNSTSVMGATKRLAELYCQALDLHGLETGLGPRFMTVRFGNVLGSSGSLIPLFKRQLARGGPLTVTDANMTRFFMTIREAVELTLQASAYGFEKQLGQGEIFVLDMGEPIKIIDIARRMIRLAGFTPDQEIEIKIIGCRPGEKLFEELFDETDKRISSPVPGVLGAVPEAIPLPTLRDAFARLQRHSERGNEAAVVSVMRELLPRYEHEADLKMAVRNRASLRPKNRVKAKAGKSEASYGAELRSPGS